MFPQSKKGCKSQVGLTPYLPEGQKMQDTLAWVAHRQRQALTRVRRAGMTLAALLLLAAGWCAWREITVERLVRTVQADVLATKNVETVLTLKRVSLTAHLAKVRNTMLLADITGNASSESPCAGIDDLRGLPPDSPCRTTWSNALRAIQLAASVPSPPIQEERLLHDPWGVPYLLNEAELGCVTSDWCPEDTLRSAGPDGKNNTADDLLATVPRYLYLYKAPK